MDGGTLDTSKDPAEIFFRLTLDFGNTITGGADLALRDDFSASGDKRFALNVDVGVVDLSHSVNELEGADAGADGL